MKISEIIAQESNDMIQIYKQGIFWTAYEESAYHIWKKKKYKINIKFIKNMKRNVLSLGFPDTAMGRLLQESNAILLEDSPTYKCFSPSTAFEDHEFKIWRQSWEERDEAQYFEKTIEKKIKNYPLEERTPLEAYLFLNELQRSIKYQTR